MSVESIFQTLKRSSESFSVIESCTGGELAKEVTSISGASDVFVGGMVPYQDSAKVNCLDIAPSLIDKHTAVSSEVVLLMAQNGGCFFKSSWCLATSGWAGPDGGTDADPVGTVYFAVVGPGHESVERRTFSGSNTREVITKQAVDYAWEYLSKVLQSKTSDKK